MYLAEQMASTAAMRGVFGAPATVQAILDVEAALARAAAARMPGYMATLLVAQDQEHERAAGGRQAEAATWPTLMLCASGGLAAMAKVLAGLEIFPDRVAENLRHLPEVPLSAAIPGLIAAALADHQTFASDKA